MVKLLLASNFRAGGLKPFERVRPEPQKGAFLPILSPPNFYCAGGLYHFFRKREDEAKMVETQFGLMAHGLRKCGRKAKKGTKILELLIFS